MRYGSFIILFLFFFQPEFAQAQKIEPWEWSNRAVHYKPQGTDFVRVEGDRRFNRALYGTNTAFRVEAGDLPEFALYLPGMGGHLRFGFTSGNWLRNAHVIETIYRPGCMIYNIRPSTYNDYRMRITALPLFSGDIG